MNSHKNGASGPSRSANGPNKQSFMVRLPSDADPWGQMRGRAHYPFTPAHSGMTTPFGNGPQLYEVVHSRPDRPAPLRANSSTLSIKKFTDSLISKTDREVVAARLGIHDTSIETILPALAGQEYHLACWLKSGRTLYEPTWAFRTPERVDEHRLRGAWAVLRRRHAVLRSTFVSVNPNEALHVILKQASGASNYTTFAKVKKRGDSASLEERTRAVLGTLAKTPSSLHTPPVRLTLVAGGKEEGDAVLITVHGAACDAWGMATLVNELAALYQGKPVIQRPPSFKRFVGEIMQARQLQAGDEEEKFWRESLGSCQDTVIGGAAKEDEDGDSCHKQTSELVKGTNTKVSDLESAAEAFGVTPHSILRLAFAHLLAEKTSSQHPVFGCFHAGRSTDYSEDVQSLVGSCVNMLPMGVPKDSLSAAYDKDQTRLITALKSIDETFNARVPFEQSRLRDVLRWAGFADDVPFNTFLNIRWNERLQEELEEIPEVPWESMDVGAAAQYSATEPIPGRTTVDELDRSIVRQLNVFVEVGPNRNTDVLEYALRCDEVLMGEVELREFVKTFDESVSRIVGCLGVTGDHSEAGTFSLRLKEEMV